MDVYRKKYILLDMENLDGVLETTTDGFNDPSVDVEQDQRGDTDYYYRNTTDPDRNNPHRGKTSASNNIITAKGWAVSLCDANETIFPSESQDSEIQHV